MYQSFKKLRQERKLLCCMEQKQLKFLAHVIRKEEELEDLAQSGRIPGKRARGAQRFTFITNLWEVARKTTQ